jgi:hypothetical protein
MVKRQPSTAGGQLSISNFEKAALPKISFARENIAS